MLWPDGRAAGPGAVGLLAAKGVGIVASPRLPKLLPTRAQLGPAIAWSDADLDQLATIGPADVAAAQAYRPLTADPRQRALLALLADLLHAQEDGSG